MFVKKKTVWEDIVSSYTRNPRDVKTVPISREGVWFYVYVIDGNVFAENARSHLENSSNIENRRRLEKEKADVMLSLYYRRKRGEKVSQEARDITVNQVYWYGIFADIGL